MVNTGIEVDQVLSQALGDPEVRFNPEKLRFLGTDPEEVLSFLTSEQVQENWVYPEIEALLSGKDNKAKPKMMVINSQHREEVDKYRQVASKYGVATRVVDNPHYSPKTGLVLVSSSELEGEADNRAIPSREKRLLAKGIPQAVIDRPGATLCPTCYDQLVKLAPEEKANYERLGWLGKTFGQECLSCDTFKD